MPTRAAILSFVLICASAFGETNAIKMDTDPQQAIDVKYRLFKTENIYNFLLLDTSTGKLWQAQFSVDEKKFARTLVSINGRILLRAGEAARVGRFTLYPTKNIYTFLLLDQDTGRLFQCQWATEGNQLTVPIEPFPEDEKK